MCLILALLPAASALVQRSVSPQMQFGNRAARLQKRTARFDGMITKLSLDPATLACVDNTRLRAVLRGVVEAGRAPDVRKAFQVLYEDMAPIRMSADLIFPRLEATVDEATSSSQTLADKASLEELDAARRLFDAIDADGSGEISREELVGSGLISIINPEEPEGAAIDSFMSDADTDQSDGVSFVEFATYAASCEQLEGADLADVLAAVNGQGGDRSPFWSGGSPRDGEAAEPPSARFTRMVEKFGEWEQRLGVVDVQENDRLGRVLLGCFAGTRVPEIVEALKVCYVDFKPLRVAGDLIFKVVGEVVERRSAPV